MCEVRHIKSTELFPVVSELLKQNKKVTMTVTGASMHPFLRENVDRVELSYAVFDLIEKGDIVLILRPSGEYILHRVLIKKKECFYIAGDAQGWIEGPVYPKQLIAVITAVFKKGKRIYCSNIRWKVPSIIWLYLMPFRRFIFKLYGFLRRIL